MNERCVDASLIVKLALEDETHSAAARHLVRQSVADGIRLIAPPIFTAEIDSVIRRCVCTGRLSQSDAREAYAVLDRAPVQIVTHPELRGRAREIAGEFNQRTVYDSTYAALAEIQGCEFWTADKALCDAVRLGLPFVKHLADYSI
jgi:predicted nucleic acid-binding protein